MNYFEKNLDVIRNTRELLYQKMQEHDLLNETKLTDAITSVETKDGNQAIVLEKDGMTYRFNSSYRPVAEAQKWVDQYSFQSLNIIVSMFGLGNGIFARELMNKMGNQEMLFILEPSLDMFLHTLSHYDITDILSEGKVSISIEGVNQIEFTTLISQCTSWMNLETRIVCYHPQYDKAFPISYQEFLKTLDNARIKAIVNKNTEAYWGEIMTKNEISNLKYLKDCNLLSDFVGAFSEVPAIIVSSGPSLDKNITELKNAKGKSVILCVDSALKYLLKNDIIPDLVVTLDAKKSMYHFADERFKQIPLLCKSVSNPVIMDLHTGRKIFFYNEDFIGSLFQQMGKDQIYYSVGGCVSTAAFAVCVGLNFKCIVMIGQDLCFHGNVTHAGNEVVNAYGANDGAAMMVEDNDGNLVKTRYDWYTFLLWFQDAIESCPGIEVINATEGGAKIKGAKVMTLKETINQYCIQDIDVLRMVNDMSPVISKDNMGMVKEYFQKSLKDMDIIEEYSKEASTICEKLIKEAKKNNIGSFVNQVLVKKILKFNKEIAEKSVYQILNDYISEISTKQLDNINKLDDNVQNNQIKTYMKSREIYMATAKAVQELRPLLEQSVLELDF